MTDTRRVELAELLPAERPSDGFTDGPFFPAAASTPNFSGAQTDARLVELWLSGKADSTRRKYVEDLADFLHYVVRKPLGAVSLSDLVEYAEDLAWLHPDAGVPSRIMLCPSRFHFPLVRPARVSQKSTSSSSFPALANLRRPSLPRGRLLVPAG